MRAFLFALACVACSQPARAPEPEREPAPPDAHVIDAPPAEIVIGHFASMTGSQAVFGLAADRGVALAIAQRNAAGGIDGAPVRLVSMDDAGLASEAGQAVTRLIDEHHVTAVIGEISSTLTLAGGEVAQAAGIPMVVPGATNPTITELSNAFRVTVLDDVLADAAARFAIEDLGVTKVAIIVDQTSDYSTNLADELQTKLTARGGTVHSVRKYTAGDQDMSPVLTKLKGAQLIFVPGYGPDVAEIIRQARKLGVKVPFLGTDGWESDVMHTLGEVFEGSYYVGQFSPLDPRPIVVDFVRAFRDAQATDPDTIAALSYDAALVLLDALDRADGGDLTAALGATRDLEGVTGTMSIDERREVVKSPIVIGFSDGAAQLVKRLD